MGLKAENSQGKKICSKTEEFYKAGCCVRDGKLGYGARDG